MIQTTGAGIIHIQALYLSASLFSCSQPTSPALAYAYLSPISPYLLYMLLRRGTSRAIVVSFVWPSEPMKANSFMLSSHVMARAICGMELSPVAQPGIKGSGLCVPSWYPDLAGVHPRGKPQRTDRLPH